MQVEVRPVERLRGDHPVDIGAALTPVLDALRDADVDLARTRIVCDWIQYRHNFREPVVARPIVCSCGVEIAVDVRRTADVDLASETAVALRPDDGRLHLEDWTPGRSSCIWQFNELYWTALAHWERTTGHEYEQALPNGASDARNVAAVHELILDLFGVWDDLTARNALPEELYVLELGVGNGNQARTWLDEFAHLDKAHGGRYYRRLHYLMGDYSRHVLERAEH